jgi:adenylate cyclase
VRTLPPADHATGGSFVPPAFTRPQQALDKRRVAVLPLQNLSPDPNDEYFADGLTEELISTISNISGLSVISRTSIMQYKKPQKKLAEIGQDLGAGTILEGSVRKSGNKIRVAVQLIEVKGDRHLWAQNYDRELQDTFTVQSDIAERVAKALEVKVLGEERHRLEGRASKNTEAIALYLKGRTSFNEENETSVRNAVDYFERAVQRDPNFALAFVGLADCYYWLEGSYISHEEGVAKAKQNLDKALEINPELGEAHAFLGIWLRNQQRWEEAERELRKACELSPSYAAAHHRYAALLLSIGKLDDALYEARKAEELDPAQPRTALRVGQVLYYRKEYNEAIEQYNQLLRLHPNFSEVFIWMANANAAKGMTDEALRLALKWREQRGDAPGSRGMMEGLLACYYLLDGRKEEADEMFKKALESNSKLQERYPSLAAFWHALRGNLDRCFEFLDNAYNARDALLFDIKVDPLWHSLLENDPRYTALLQKLHLS